MLLDVWKTGTVDNSFANTLGGTKYIYFKQVVPARSRWFQLVPRFSIYADLLFERNFTTLVLWLNKVGLLKIP